MSFVDGVWLVAAFPLGAFLINALLGRGWLGHRAGIVGAGAIGASAVLSLGVFVEVLGGRGQATVPLYTWIAVEDFHSSVAALVDPLSALMLVVVTVVSFLVHVYSIGYMGHDDGYPRFFTWMPLFVFAMLLLVMADNYLLMFVGWEGVGLCSYLLIGYWFERHEPAVAAKKAFVMNRIGDWGFTVGLILTFLVFGSVQFVEVFERVGIVEQGVLTLICLAFFLGAVGKSAQLPLYSWLPDAMEGPTPVSALIHAATMVTAGVYLVARSTPLFEAAGAALTVVAIVGAVTAIFAATIALVQVDIKRVMAYSTVSQLGYMFLALGVGAPIAAMFHLTTHAFFKALLFLGSGSVIHALGGEQDMRRMGGLRRKLPLTFWTMVIAGAALAAIPPFAGFWSKDEIVGAALLNGFWQLWLIGIVTGALTAFYTTRALWLTFEGQPRDAALFDHAHESPPVMSVPLVVLAAGSVLAGLIGIPPERGFLQSFLPPAIYVHGHEPHYAEFTTLVLLAGAAVALGIVGILVALAMYARRLPDPAAVARAAGPLYAVLWQRYFVDELYDRRFVGAMRQLFGAAWWIDEHIVDGLVDRLGWAFQLAGRGTRRLQTGIVGNYALSIVAGLLVLMGVYAGYALRAFGR
jgi:NADH-quinone oxidoreductase subunit L